MRRVSLDSRLQITADKRKRGFDPNGAMVAMAQLSSPLSLEHELRMLDAAIAGLNAFLRQYSDPELQGAQSPEDVDLDW
eukprot:scaffold254226_cov14-Prasinocladus_malaysianus.AAC.1